MMNEYAVRVLYMVEHSLRIDAGDKLDAISVSSAPHMDDGARKRMVKDLEIASKDPIEILEGDGDERAYDKAREILGK